MERQSTQGKLHKSKKKKHGKRKQKTQTNSGQNHKEKDPRKAAHILREKEKKRSAIYVGNPSGERLGGEFLGCWKCWKCWECWKIYDFSTLSMFSMLSMLQKEGNAAQDTPSLRMQFAPNTAQGAHKFHKGETARQGRQHSAGGAHKLHKGETARQGRQHSAGGAHKLHKGETARQGRQHSAGEAHKLHEGDTARQVRQHSAGERTSSAGRQDTARATAQESRNEGGRLSEVATLAVVVLETYNHVVIERCKVCVDLLQLLAHFTGFKPCAYDRYNY